MSAHSSTSHALDTDGLPPDLELLDVAGVRTATGLSRDFCRRLVYGRQVPTVRIGGRVFVRRSDLASWIQANTQPARES